MIRKFTNVLLTRTLGGCMASLIRRPSLTLLQVVFHFCNVLWYSALIFLGGFNCDLVKC